LTPAFQLFLAANKTAAKSGAAQAQRGRLSRNPGLMTCASVMSIVFVVVLGRGDAAKAPAEDVGWAVSMTFTGAAGLALHWHWPSGAMQGAGSGPGRLDGAIERKASCQTCFGRLQTQAF